MFFNNATHFQKKKCFVKKNSIINIIRIFLSKTYDPEMTPVSYHSYINLIQWIYLTHKTKR